MTREDIVRDWYRRLWELGDLTVLDDYLATGADVTGYSWSEQTNVSDYQTMVDAFQELLESIQFQIEVVAETGEWIACSTSLTAYCPGNGRNVSAGGASMMRIRNGRILESRINFDFITLFEQMDLLPKDTMAICLGGAPLHSV